ncbi:MAG: hypothetical protein IPH13_15330 [Planctomycetes bacterium]|nr:hypothetical protein [Planctomycetota bacterium]
MVTQFRRIGASLVAWVAVWAFWLIVTRDFHPLFSLAVVVTTSLVVAYAAAAYVNHLVLIPRLNGTGRRWSYAISLAMTMAVLTAAALAVIRVTYAEWWGPDPDPNGVFKHYAIDLFGMAVHVLLAAGVVAVVRRLRRAHSSSKSSSTAVPRR